MFNEILKQILLIWSKFSRLQRVLVISVLAGIFSLSLIFTHSTPKEKPAPVVVQKEIRGFELFDSNTWIKGEKELQMLELRALKGQLEKEIEKFENIESASVILDLGSVRRTNAITSPTASVLLTIKPGVVLSESTITAIVCHLLGGIRGLDEKDISVSDSTGRIYKGVLPSIDRIIQRERLEKQVEAFLSKVIGSASFYIQNLQVYIDKKVWSEELEKALKAFSEEQIVCHWIRFPEEIVEKNTKKIPLLAYVAALPLLFLLPLLFRKKKRKRSDKEMLKMMRKVDPERLVELVKREKPQTIALLLTYLDPARAEKVITNLPTPVQEEVLSHLSEMES